MTEELKCCVADLEQRRAAHANVHDVWSRGLPLDDHIARRMNSLLNQRATWYVGSLAGRVVAGLGCHPVLYHVDDRTLPGIAIAAVHTLPEFRGHGFAPRLIDFVERRERERGARLSALFSDIQPAYYERMGYERAPAHRGWVDATAAAAPPSDVALDRFSGVEHVAEVATIFNSAHGHRPLSIERPPEYGRHLIDRYQDDEFYWLTLDGTRQGYLRLYKTPDALVIRDYAVRDHRSELQSALFASLVALARDRGLSRAGGWMPDDETTRAWFTITDREQEITMFKPLDAAITIRPEHLAAADQILEIDHV